jgi:hypothetical protein
MKKQPTPTQLHRTEELVRQGLTTNAIQRELQREHIGYRRTILLARIRAIKGVKQVALYGTAQGQNQRIQLKGTGPQLNQAVKHALFNPPREEKFVTKNADSYLRAVRKREEKLGKL